MSHKRENDARNTQSQWRIPGKTHWVGELGEIRQWQWLHSGNTTFLCWFPAASRRSKSTFRSFLSALYQILVLDVFHGIWNNDLCTFSYQNGNPDKTYFAPDCFHFSEKGHRDAAVALWNNMVRCTHTHTTQVTQLLIFLIGCFWNQITTCTFIISAQKTLPVLLLFLKGHSSMSFWYKH